jgi:hypothetical protein
MGEPWAIGCADTPNIQATPEIQHGSFEASVSLGWIQPRLQGARCAGATSARQGMGAVLAGERNHLVDP